MKVIAEKIKASFNDPSIGYIKPVYVFKEEENKYVEANPESFPNNGEIFIRGGYNSYIDQVYADYDFFIVDKITENEKSYNSNSNSHCLYIANANSVEKLPDTEFLPIYNFSFNINNRNITRFEADKVVPWFIKDGDYIFGPLAYDSTNKVWTAIKTNSFETNIRSEIIVINDFIKQYEDCVLKFKIEDISTLLIESYSDETYGYLSNFLNLLKKEPIDIIYVGGKDKAIIWGKNFLKPQFTAEENEVLKKIQTLSFPKISNKIDKQKLDIFKNSINEVNEWVNVELPKFLEDYLKSPKGIIERDNFLNDNKEAFFKTYRKNEVDDFDRLIEQKKINWKS